LVLVARSKDKLEDLKAELEKKHSVKVYVIAKDLAKVDAGQEVFDETQKENIKIEVLINNAGIGTFGRFHESTWQKQKMMLDLNIMAVTQLCFLYSKEMVKSKTGSIMNVSSVAAFQPGPLMAIYFASKAYVLHFSEAIDNEVREHGVNVSVLCPGPTQSEFFDKADLGETRFSKSSKLATSKEVAEFGYDAMLNNEAVCVHGKKNRWQTYAPRFMTRAKMVSIIGEMQRKIR
jgi:hypothetical protein